MHAHAYCLPAAIVLHALHRSAAIIAGAIGLERCSQAYNILEYVSVSAAHAGGQPLTVPHARTALHRLSRHDALGAMHAPLASSTHSKMQIRE